MALPENKRWAFFDNPPDGIYDNTQFPYYKVQGSSEWVANPGNTTLTNVACLLMEPNYSFLLNDDPWMDNISAQDWITTDVSGDYEPPQIYHAQQYKTDLGLLDSTNRDSFLKYGIGVDPQYITDTHPEMGYKKDQQTLGYIEIGNYLHRYESQEEIYNNIQTPAFVVELKPKIRIKNFDSTKGAYWTGGGEYGPTTLKPIEFEFTPDSQIRYHYYNPEVQRLYSLKTEIISTSENFTTASQSIYHNINPQTAINLILPTIQPIAAKWGNTLNALNDNTNWYTLTDIAPTLVYSHAVRQFQAQQDYKVDLTGQSIQIPVDLNLNSKWTYVINPDWFQDSSWPDYSKWESTPQYQMNEFFLPNANKNKALYTCNLWITPNIQFDTALPKKHTTVEIVNAGRLQPLWTTVNYDTYTNPVIMRLYSDFKQFNMNGYWANPIIDIHNDRVFYKTFNDLTQYKYVNGNITYITDNAMTTWTVNEFPEMYQGVEYGFISKPVPEQGLSIFFVWEALDPQRTSN